MHRLRTSVPWAVVSVLGVGVECGGRAVAEEEKPRYFTRAEVARHASPEDRIWVTYKTGVYDITDFVANHPGGTDKIMLAAGKAIDPFWRIYQQHLNSRWPMEHLKGMQVGELDPSEAPTEVDAGDPYAMDPERHPGLIFHNNKPSNAELPPALVMQDWLTPAPLWFIRHHHPVPQIQDVSKFRLKLEGIGVRGPVQLTLDDVKDRFPRTSVTTTIQCGGNRRGGMNTVEKTSGIAWGIGAISTAKWTGVLLRDVLKYSGLLTPEVAEMAGVRHIRFKGMDGMQASIPVEKALDPFGDVLLAYEMNGETLPEDHGFPLRVVVPGVVGVRNVKWLSEIEASSEEAEGPWQRGMAYKGFGPNVKDLSGIDVEKVQSMQEMPVTSAIVSPQEGDVIELDEEEDGTRTVGVRGWAWSGGGRGIVRVDVSADGGQHWVTAELGDGKDQNPRRAWAWTFWSCDSVPVPEGANGQIEVCCRATDSSYSVQPERPEPIWNIRGLNNVSWHRVKLKVSEEAAADQR